MTTATVHPALVPARTSIALFCLMLLAVWCAALLRPELHAVENAADLETVVPKAFGEWRQVTNTVPQVSVSQGVETSQEQPYDQTVLRTYVNKQGDVMMLALAWGQRQRQDVKVHRPEVCYPAQGLSVMKLAAAPALQLAGSVLPVPTVQLLAGNRNQLEAVRYWIRIGGSYGGDGLKARWYILKEGLQGRVPDGILVRASQRIRSETDSARSQAQMAQFLSELVAAVPQSARVLLVR